jgi:hypothetical protein
MLLNPRAVEKLKSVTWYPYYYRTHAQRNEQERRFLEETERLLDQQAESTIKHLVECYCQRDISYEEYSERVEQISKEEEVRGAALGAASARNHVFDFAQRVLDREKEQIATLTLAEAQKNYEVERQKADQVIKDAVQQGLAEIATATQQLDEQKNTNTQMLQALGDQKVADLNVLTSKQEEHLLHQHEQLMEQTKTQIDQVVFSRLQEEIDKLGQEIHERENLRPARDAARTAIAHVTLQERQLKTYKLFRNGLRVLSALVFSALLLTLIFLSLPQWGIVVLLVIIAAIFIATLIWKSPVSETTVLGNKKEVAFFQTKSGDYGSPLNEEERCTLLVQRVIGPSSSSAHPNIQLVAVQ